jgi:hypothetical protein
VPTRRDRADRAGGTTHSPTPQSLGRTGGPGGSTAAGWASATTTMP